jgi:hypothetical protein
MKGAGLIYLLCGLLIVGAGLLGITFGNGFVVGTLALMIFGAAFLFMGRGLLLGKQDVRAYAIVISSLITLGFGAEAIWFVVDEMPAIRKFGASSMFWWIVGPFAAIALVHALALVLLLRSKPPISPADKTPATPPSPRA